MSRKLVIVESPTKARKIADYLGSDYEVEASVGHIRDLPQPSELPADIKKGPYGRFAVDVDNGFEPYYMVNADKKAKVRELKQALKNADELYLATDEDREGEAIAWHLLEELKPKVPVRRMVFHEITKEAITRALEHTRDIDTAMVDAQETRRILDRLYGWEVSPVLWRKVRSGLSAGRVQSVATRLIVDRERARMAFVQAEYWDVFGQFHAVDGAQTLPFTARLTALDGVRVATGRDFDAQAELTNQGVVHLVETGARAVVAGLADSAFRVSGVDEKAYSRKPAAPFTTSTLQQEAGRKLRMGARHAMRVAQSLYENGYITYMRTDSVALSAEAVAAARKQAVELYGGDSIPPTPRTYATKSKGAQEAHEAIRPAGDHFRTPAQVKGELHGDQFRLYELIWKRTIASQMADAKGFTASIKISGSLSGAAGSFAGQEATFSATGTVITFRGFLAAYEEGRDAGETGVDGSAAADPEAGESDARLPKLAVGQALNGTNLKADGHRTNPPARFTEASLVKALEELGIGRPSTYAATISTIQDRGYVQNVGQALVPTWLSFAVTKLLENHFDWLVDYDFTAKMESDLDDIANGDRDRRKWLEVFYFGDGTETRRGIKDRVENLPEIDPVAINSVHLGDGLRLRVGRFGPYVEDLSVPVKEGEAPPRASVPPDLAPDELTAERARELLTAGTEEGRSIGFDPATGTEIVVRTGRFGPYVTELLPEPEVDPNLSAAAKKKALATLPKPRTASLFASMTVDSVTLAQALQLMSLPRVIGTDPETGAEITAQNGRYGPYIKRGTDSRTIAAEPLLFTMTLPEALAVFAEPKQRRGARAAAAPLRELGIDPESEKPIVIKEGRFGAYLTDGVTNRTMPREFSIELITPEQAISLLAEKRAAGPAPKRGAKAKKAPASAAKKAPAATAKKAPVATAKKVSASAAKTAPTATAHKPSANSAGLAPSARQKDSGLAALTVAQLRELALGTHGLTVPARAKKADVIAAIETAQTSEHSAQASDASDDAGA